MSIKFVSAILGPEMAAPILGTSDFQSEVGEVFSEIGGELPAKFGRRFSSFLCWENRQKHPPQISPSNSTTGFWVVAGPTILWAPGKMRSFCWKNHVHKIPRFRGVFWVFWGGKCRFYFMGARIFLIFVWDYSAEKANFCGHSRVHLREHWREHLREPFRGSIGGSYFAFASSVLHCLVCM